jgi:hypothetical protein
MYGIIPLIAATALAYRHCTRTRASRLCKRLVLAALAATFLLPYLGRGAALGASLAQVALCVFLLLYWEMAKGSG